MSYVVAGYVFVLSALFVYGVHLAWRQRRLTRAVERVRRAGDVALREEVDAR